MLGPTALALALLAAWAAPAGADHPIEGTLQGVHADYFDLDTSVTKWRVDTGDQTLKVLPTTLPALTPEQAEVKVDDEQPGPGVVGPVTASLPQAVPTPGGRKTAVIAFNFASAPTSQPWTVAQIRQNIFIGASSTSTFFREESYGQLWLTGRTGNLDGDVYGWYPLPTAPTTCDYTTWATLAKTAAQANGFVAADYQHVMYVFPGQSVCGWAGLAYMPGKESWINGDLTVRVTAHELGHNLGLHHAGSWYCTDASDQAVVISGTCDLNEYNDPWDVMGAFGDRHSHGWHLQRLGFLAASNVQTIEASGTYSMRTAFTPTTEATTLRIPRTYSADGVVQDWYYLEIRSPGGTYFDDFSLNDWAVKGVSIRVTDNPAQSTVSRLLDVHPGGAITDAPLRPGETFNDGQVSVSTVSAGSGVATVAIDLAAPPQDVQAPLAPAGLSHVLSGTTVRLSWLPSGDNVGVSSYAVYRDGVQIGSSASASYDDASASPGQRAYTVRARDAAGNLSAASAPHVVTVPAAATNSLQNPGTTFTDRAGPRVSLKRRRIPGGRILFSVRARDRAGVARVELRIDRRRASARRAPRLSYRWRLRPGRHRVVVVAYDKRGNRSVSEYRLRVRA